MFMLTLVFALFADQKTIIVINIKKPFVIWLVHFLHGVQRIAHKILARSEFFLSLPKSR